jgi:hypothetical protein
MFDVNVKMTREVVYVVILQVILCKPLLTLIERSSEFTVYNETCV